MEIDYYAYFSKAYFAFNAYIKKNSDLSNDRERINEIRDHKQNIQVKFNSLLSDNREFLINIVELNNLLNSLEIKNKEEIVTFQKIRIKTLENDKIILDDTNYFIKLLKNYKIAFSEKTEKNKFTCNRNELDNYLKNYILDKNKIKEIVKKVEEFDEIDVSGIIKSLEENLHSKGSDIDDLVYKAFIEVIYLMRNALFHSEISPLNEETKKAYEKAYWLLREFVRKMS